MSEAKVLLIGRAERNKLDKRERLIRAARELFRTHGFEATTTGEIAGRAGVAKGTLFFHAKSKEALLVMMFQRDVGRAIERGFSTLPEGAPVVDQLMHVFKTMLRQHQRDIGLARVFVKELGFVRGDRHGIEGVLHDMFARLGGVIEDAKLRGELRPDVDSFLLGRNLFALFFVFLLQWLGSGERSPWRRRPSLREMLEMQLSGLRCSTAEQIQSDPVRTG
ncbi:MAG TPA: helix-turn-helix domain-containing protein [Candidatus Binataceae bacterium]|nr:helix-turn-helix domain-containing protein [Candidatus Binataceae bacterium]